MFLIQAAREIYRSLMDAVDPALVDQAEQARRAVPGVLDVGQVRLRWIGHQLRAGEAARHPYPEPEAHVLRDALMPERVTGPLRPGGQRRAADRLLVLCSPPVGV